MPAMAVLFTVVLGTTGAVSDNVGDAVAKAGSVDTQITDELKLANEAFYEAVSGRDIWGMGQLWAKDDSVSAIFPAHDRPYFGWDNVRMSWTQAFDHNRDIKIKSLAGIIQAQGDNEGNIAWIIDSTRFESFQTQTGQPILMPNVITTKIFERRDGKWLLMHYHAHLPGLIPPTPSDEDIVSRPITSDAAPDVKAADDLFFKALSESDLNGMSKVWTPSDAITAIQPDFDVPFAGEKNVMESWRIIFEHNKDIRISDVSDMVHVAGNVAWIVGSHAFEAARDEKTVHLPGVLVTKIFEKRGAAWLMVHYHAHIGPLAHFHMH